MGEWYHPDRTIVLLMLMWTLQWIMFSQGLLSHMKFVLTAGPMLWDLSECTPVLSLMEWMQQMSVPALL